MTVTYATGYSGTRRSLAELLTWSRFSPVHPEVQRRVIRLMDNARASGRPNLGVGGAFRSSAEQTSLFLSRHDVVASGGCCGYNGRRYALKAGQAHAAPPGRSYHEETLNGKCFALDMVGWEDGWMEKNLAAHGLRSFATLSGNVEPWHIQPVEIPTYRGSYNPTIHVLKTWSLPTIAPTQTAPDVPTPTIRLGSSGGEVVELQQHMTFWGWYKSAIDGACGPITVEGIKRLQNACKVGADGVYGSVTAQAYQKFLVAMKGL